MKIIIVLISILMGFNVDAQPVKPNWASPETGLVACAGIYIYLSVLEPAGSTFSIKLTAIAKQFINAAKSYTPQAEYEAGAFAGILFNEKASKQVVEKTAGSCINYGRQYGVIVK